MNKLFPLQSDHPLFRYLSPDERKHIEGIGKVRKIGNEGYLIRAREADSTLYAVEDGHLDIVRMENGRPTIVATVGPGDVLGEVSFIDDSPRALSVKARAETVTVRAWNKQTLSEALAAQPELLAKFSVALCELLAERLRDVARRV